MNREGTRYEFIREKVGLSKKDFAKSLGLSMSMGSQIASNLIKPSRSLLCSLANTYNVNPHWFLTGKGPSGLDNDTIDIELLEQEAAAGHGREAEDYPEKRFFQIPCSFIAPYRPDRLLAVCVAGDSMIEAHICDGDIVIFHPGITGGNGIFVVAIGNSLVIKRIDRDIASRTIVLYSANPAFEPRRFSGPELEDIRIAGKVVAVYHRV
jgi:SOS-response transcriptional repressor LexA